ncbi:MAG: hypothetical protein IT175_05595 [Acidobacteria bacterium]|nr:hypothetical protein [Acidobacteriota bacterium]
MAGMKFRKSCDLCNVTFFSPNRNALYCSKCSKRMGVADPAVAPVTGGKPARPAAVEVRKAGPRAAVADAARPRSPVLVKKVKKGPRPPKPTDLTDEIRQQITEAFGLANGGSESLRELHASIAEKLWVRRWMVAEVIQDVTAKMAHLTPELREQAWAIYRDMVERHERPAGGRRRAIATQLNVPIKEVILAVRDLARKQDAASPTPRLSRQQLFEIERAYWLAIQAREHSLDELPQTLADSLGYANRWQVLRWIDVLHDDPRAFEAVPDPAPEHRDEIVRQYLSYLESTTPPDKGLHQTIAESLGGSLKPRQVHKVLQAFRHERRANYAPSA